MTTLPAKSYKVPEQDLLRLNEVYQSDLMQLMMSYPFICFVLLKLKLEPKLEGVASVGGGVLKLNAVPFSSGNQDKTCYWEYNLRTRLTILLHEAMHLVLGHLPYDTVEFTDHMLVNICQDAIINRYLKQFAKKHVDFTEFPDHVKDLNDTGIEINGYEFGPVPDYLQRDWQSLYKYLEQSNLKIPDKSPKSLDDLTVMGDDFCSNQEMKEQIDKVLDRMSDSIPELIKRTIWDIPQAKRDYAQEIRFCLQQMVDRSDYRYMADPRKSHIAWIPQLRNKRISKIYLAIDTSGSMSKLTLEQGIAELSKIQKQAGCDIELIVCDHEITAVHKFSIHNPISWKTVDLPGHRMTNFRPVFEYIKKQNEEVVLLVFFTDTMGAFPDTKPNYPVLWVSNYSGAKVPFGRLLKI